MEKTKKVITSEMLDWTFEPGIDLEIAHFHVGEGKAGELDFNNVTVHLEGMLLGVALDWIFAGNSARVKIAGQIRNMDREAALVQKKIYEDEGLYLRDVPVGRTSRKAKPQDPRVWAAGKSKDAIAAAIAELQKMADQAPSKD